ncbi:MAG: B12-binding domain-containing radical SAM protein [Candidatus Heimdallarchaeota archaeon]
MKKVRLVSISFPGRDLCLAPVSLKSYALKDPEIAKRVSISISQFDIGTPNAKIAKDLLMSRDDILGFTTYVWNVEKILDVSRRLKSADPAVLILLGGPQVTGLGETLLSKHEYLDFIVEGEGEKAFKRFLRAAESSTVPGLVYRINGSIDSNPEEPLASLDDLSLPYENRDYRNYLDGCASPVRAAIETSRGCPFSCAYCTWGKRKMRYFDLEKLKPAFKYLFNHPKVKTIYITDSNPFLKKGRSKELLEFIIKENVHKKLVTFEASPEYITDDQTLDLILELGNEEFAFGVQSTSPAVLERIQRRFDPVRYQENIRLIRSKNPNIEMWFSLIIGLPGDNYRQFLKSVEFVLNLEPTGIYFHELLCLPGSDLYKDPEKYGLEYQEEAPHKVTKNESFPMKEYKAAKELAYFVYLMHRSGESKKILHLNGKLGENRKLIDLYLDLRDFMAGKSDLLEEVKVQDLFSWFFERKATEFLQTRSNTVRLTQLVDAFLERMG